MPITTIALGFDREMINFWCVLIGAHRGKQFSHRNHLLNEADMPRAIDALQTCRFIHDVKTDSESCNDSGFCSFELLQCSGCVNESAPVYVSNRVDDPMTSAIFISWSFGPLQPAK